MVLLLLILIGCIVFAFFAEMEKGRDTAHRGWNLCPSCGRSVESEWMICPNCRFMLREHCRVCGHQRSVFHRYCPHCGLLEEGRRS